MNDEEKVLQDIIIKIKERIEEINENLDEGAREIEKMHDYYWENYTEMDEFGYESFDNQQALLNQVNSNQEQLRLQKRLKKMQDSPYFGRVDFRFDDEDEPDRYYIGIGNFSQKAGSIPLIYDWRAPVCSLFYDYDKGRAQYEAPGGLMTGEITSKWQCKIRGGKLLYAFESDVKIDDEVLLQELGQNGDVKLKSIVCTIQREQNVIIRNQKDRILVIQGVAGSGKTSVALHRIAYILYHNRKTIKASNILILSPNGAFADYISHILPELGEENIMEMSFDVFAFRELRDTICDCEERFDHIERLLQGNEEKTWKYKQSRGFMEKLNGYVLMLEDSLMNFKDIKRYGIEKPARDIRELFYDRFPDIPLLKRMDVVMDYIVDESETLRGKDFEEEEKNNIRETFLKMYKTMDLYEIYNGFLLEENLPQLPKVLPEQRTLPYEDLYPLLYLRYQLYGRSRRHENIRHLVIDEMQDYSYLQYVILEQLFHCKMTILGDKAQTIGDVAQDVTVFLPRILGRDLKIVTLNKSYRSTVEIAGYARSVLGDDKMDLFERHGMPVQQRDMESREQALDYVAANLKLDGAEKIYETAAVITRTAGEAEFAYKYLQRQVDERILSYIDKNSRHFKCGLVVTTFYCAKGLEFDQVFALQCGREKRAVYRQADYITATRALHELHVLHVSNVPNYED